MKFETILSKISILNLVFVLFTNTLIFWTWFNIWTSNFDNMFMGLLIIPLFLVTIYYLTLLIWAYRLLKKRNCLAEDDYIESFILFLLNIIPIAIIFKLTT